MKGWKDCLTFLSPKGIFRNSYSLKGVMTAILGTSCGATGNW